MNAENDEFCMSRGKGHLAGISEKRTRKGSWISVVKGLMYYARKFGLEHIGKRELLKAVKEGVG